MWTSAGTVSSGLAEKWDGTARRPPTPSRKGITCADGTTLTASTVADNINFVGDPKNAPIRVGIFVPPGATAKGDDAAGTVTVTPPRPPRSCPATSAGCRSSATRA